MHMYLYEKIAREKERKEKQLALKPLPPKPDKRYISMMCSAAHTYGNALAFLQNYIIDLFPKDMFKTIHVNSKIAHRQIRSTPHEFVKKLKPMIIFRPRIGDYNEDRFLKGTPLGQRTYGGYSTWGATPLQPFIEDQKHDLMVKFQHDRYVLYIDVVVVFSTLINQINYFEYFKNNDDLTAPKFLPAHLESYLPLDMLQVISDTIGIPIYDENGNTKEFLDYMNGISAYPVTYKLQGSTQSREFYRYYDTNMDVSIMDLSREEGEKVGNIMDQYSMSFTVRAEFWGTGFYYLFNDNIYDLNLPVIPPEQSDIIPIFTDDYYREDLNLAQGWTLYNRGTCRLDSGSDEVDFDQMLNNSIREAMRYHLDNGLLMQEFMDFKIRRQGKPIHEGQDYFIDWKRRKLIFSNQNTYYTYSIMLCLNIAYINDLVKAIYNLK